MGENNSADRLLHIESISFIGIREQVKEEILQSLRSFKDDKINARAT